MSEEELDRAVHDHVGVDRRDFVKRMLLGTAFAVPVVASFDMESLTGVAKAEGPQGATRRHQHLRHSFPYGLRHHGDDTHTEF